MKWTSSSSSVKSAVFYTTDAEIVGLNLKNRNSSDSDSIFTYKMGADENVSSAANRHSSHSSHSNNSTHSNQNQEIQSSSAKANGVKNDLKKYLQNYILFSSLEIESEKNFRDDQLNYLLKLMNTFETKLRQEQKVIQQQLYEKDVVINRQMHTISSMKEKYGECEGAEDDWISETAKYCPMCRKKYYLMANQNIGTQTSVHRTSILKNSHHHSDDYSSIQSIEYMSSSEEHEQSKSQNPFTTARRSKKYTSKKSYKEYMKTRQHQQQIHNLTNGSTNGPSENPLTDNQVEIAMNRQKDIIASENGNKAKFSLIVNDIHGIKTKLGYDKSDTHSNKINRMHGINHQEAMLDNYQDNASVNSEESNKNLIITITNVNEDRALYNASSFSTKIDTTKKYTEGMELKTSSDDLWYVSASDVEDSDTVIGKSAYSGSTTVNPVLECVNQILLQQSMDGFMETVNESKNAAETKSTKIAQPTATRLKRVHFSTKNSMVQVPRNVSTQSQASDQKTYEQSIYSNEYEKILGSDNTSNTNYYVDMEAKENDDTFEKKKIPPALPPKPANLMKLQQISKHRTVNPKQTILKQSKVPSDYESEPDYCSISEIQDAVRSVKIVTSAEIHKEAEDDYSEIKDEVVIPKKILNLEVNLENLDDSFADVPKLPNVTEIVPPSPRKDLNCIGQDNYITKSPFGKKSSLSSHKKITVDHKDDANTMANDILAEINVKSPTLKSMNKRQPKSPHYVSTVTPHQPLSVAEDKSHIQEEFDWYNLDAEYGKPQSDAIKEPGELYQFGESPEEDSKVEYNLDDEYNSNPDIENNFTTVIKINETNGEQIDNKSLVKSCVNSLNSVNAINSVNNNGFLELAETPKLEFKHKNRINYENFLNQSGLASKPIILPRKNHRMFSYAGPFV